MAEPEGVERTAVVLLQLGGPDSLDDIEPFLKNMFRDPDLLGIQAPDWLISPFAAAFARWRAPKARPLYASIGGKSPIGEITRRQAELLAEALENDPPCHVTVGMRYGRPTIDDAIREVRRRACTKIVLLPLYPQYCVATTGSSVAEWHRRCAAAGLDLPTGLVGPYFDHPRYLDALAGRIDAGLQSLPPVANVHLIFSAHGIPVRLVKRGDPYQSHIERTVELLIDRCGFDGPHTLCYQSRIGPQKWLDPTLTAVLQELGRSGTEAVLVVPISFVSDHLETLSEIDIEAREDAKRWGIRHFATTEGLNEDPAFVEALADLVRGRIPTA